MSTLYPYQVEEYHRKIAVARATAGLDPCRFTLTRDEDAPKKVDISVYCPHHKMFRSDIHEDIVRRQK